MKKKKILAIWMKQPKKLTVYPIMKKKSLKRNYKNNLEEDRI